MVILASAMSVKGILMGHYHADFGQGDIDGTLSHRFRSRGYSWDIITHALIVALGKTQLSSSFHHKDDDEGIFTEVARGHSPIFKS